MLCWLSFIIYIVFAFWDFIWTHISGRWEFNRFRCPMWHGTWCLFCWFLELDTCEAEYWKYSMSGDDGRVWQIGHILEQGLWINKFKFFTHHSIWALNESANAGFRFLSYGGAAVWRNSSTATDDQLFFFHLIRCRYLGQRAQKYFIIISLDSFLFFAFFSGLIGDGPIFVFLEKVNRVEKEQSFWIPQK